VGEQVCVLLARRGFLRADGRIGVGERGEHDDRLSQAEAQRRCAYRFDTCLLYHHHATEADAALLV
jgi:hypothetical protein